MYAASIGVAFVPIGGAKLRCVSAAENFVGGTAVRLDCDESTRVEVSDVTRAAFVLAVCASAETTMITVPTNMKDALNRNAFMNAVSFRALLDENAPAFVCKSRRYVWKIVRWSEAITSPQPA